MEKKTLILILLLNCLLCFGGVGQPPNYSLYELAYAEIDSMLTGKKPVSFKRAVFLTEDAYEDGRLNYERFIIETNVLSDIATANVKANRDFFLYDAEDKETVLKWASIFRVMTDTIPFIYEDSLISHHIPFTYDFEDIMGREDWRKMFVSKLLMTKKGNCHSLPYLYKIIAENMGVSAHLSLAPNHIYIKHRSARDGMYNTELTSSTFPVDAWLMASGYIHLDAVRSGIYMEALNDSQSLALCLVDLAIGFKKKFGTDNDVLILKYCERALQVYPNYINALLLKAEIWKGRFDKIMEENGATSPNDVKHLKKAQEMFMMYENLIVKIHQLGYRKMPEKMYLEWLVDLNIHKEKYSNKKVIDNFKTSKTN